MSDETHVNPVRPYEAVEFVGAEEHAAGVANRLVTRITELEQQLVDARELYGCTADRMTIEMVEREETDARLAELSTLIRRQLTPLDVAHTHIEIIRRKGDEYTAQERDNVAAIVEQHIEEVRKALFDALADRGE